MARNDLANFDLGREAQARSSAEARMFDDKNGDFSFSRFH